MFESSSTCPTSEYSHIVHTLEGTTSVAPRLKHITNVVLKLKEKLAKMNAETKEIKK